MADNRILNANVSRVGPGFEGLKSRDLGKKGEFEEALKSLREISKGGPSQAPKLGGLESTQAGALKFSNHAIERMRTRGLSFSPEQLTRIEQGVQKAASKGAQNTLLMADGAALIVSVKNNTVVTVMDPSQMKDSVVTNIDSTVLV